MPTCTARTKSHRPCQARALAGTNVCRMHGGGAPQVRAKALERLLRAADPLAADLVAIARDKEVPVRDRLTAIRDILDRAGLSAKQRHELTGEDGGPVVLKIGEGIKLKPQKKK